MMLHRKADRRKFINMEFCRFIQAIILTPAMIIRRARTITARVIGWQPCLDRMLSAWRTIKATSYG